MTHSSGDGYLEGEWGRVHGTGIWMSEPLWGGGHEGEAQNVTVILMVGCQGAGDLSGQRRGRGLVGSGQKELESLRPVGLREVKPALPLWLALSWL